MSQERNRVLAGELVSRASVEAASSGSLDAALDACDYDGAASIALARAKAGEALDAQAIGRVLVGLEFPPIANALIAITKDRVGLLDVIASRAFPRTKDASEIETMALYAAWRAGADRARIIPELRRLAARTLTAEAYALLSTIAASIDDANVQAACKPIATFAKEYAKSVTSDDKAMNATLDAVLAALPANVEASRGGFTVRAAAKEVGRNEPCPCGSGLKYKKCHADKPEPAASAPSPIPGVSWDDFLAGDKLTGEHIADLPLRDLVRANVTRLGRQPLAAALRRFANAKLWSHALRIVEAADALPPKTPEEIAAEQQELEARLKQLYKGDPKGLEAARQRLRDTPPIAFGDELRDELVHQLLDDRNIDLARPLIAKLPAPLAAAFQLDLAVTDGGEWAVLLERAREVVTQRDAALATELAYNLLRTEPVLGILAARACIGAWLVDDAEGLLEAVEEARDALNLPPTDPAWDVLDTIAPDEAKPKKAPRAAKLDAEAAEAVAKIDQLERALAATRKELADAKTRPATELMRQPEQRDKVDERIRALEALIREGNEERRELRKQLEAVQAAQDRARPARPIEDEAPDDDDGDELEIGSRAVAIPRFERRALDALAEVPATVAAETMRTVGTLAAGDPYAWRGVKAAKDMPRQVLMGRVGIHHRLIFRSDGGNLEVLDLITREQLQTTLKRLRQSR